MRKMFALTFLGFGLALGGGLAYLLATDPNVRLVALVLGIVVFTMLAWGIPMLLIVRWMSRGPGSVTYHSGNYRQSWPVMGQPQQLGPGQYDPSIGSGWGPVVEAPVEAEGREIIG